MNEEKRRIFIDGDIRLDEPFTLERPLEDVVVMGKINSSKDISIKVKNLIIFGEIISTANVTIETVCDFFNAGKVSADNNLSLKVQTLFNGLDDIAINRIRALGVQLSRVSNGQCRVQIPRS